MQRPPCWRTCNEPSGRAVGGSEIALGNAFGRPDETPSDGRAGQQDIGQKDRTLLFNYQTSLVEKLL